MTEFQRRFLSYFVFGTGLVVLVLELTASRLLAPYFGTSSIVWSNVIGVILIALSLGYWWGGKIADRWPDFRLLMRIVIVAGCLTALIPILYEFMIDWMINALSTFAYGTILLSFAAALILFFIPALLLGMVSPFAVRLIYREQTNLGRAAGSLYAWSTMGSILGTFITSFVAVPFLGTRETIVGAAGMLLVLAVIGLRDRWSWLWLSVPILIGTLLLWPDSARAGQALRPRVGAIYETESPYQYIQVVETATATKLITNDGFGVQSVFPKQSIWTDHYYDVFSALPPLVTAAGEPLSVLIIGVAGGTINWQLQQLYADTHQLSVTGVEIDREMIATAQRFVPEALTGLDVVIADGREFLRHDERLYDLIIVDAYASLTMPFHLATREFFQELADHLQPKGAVALNVISTSDETRVLTGLVSTVREALPELYLSRLQMGYNYLMVASTSPLEWDSADFPPQVEEVLERIHDGERDITALPAGRVFTDNWAPIEYFSEQMYLRSL